MLRCEKSKLSHGLQRLGELGNEGKRSIVTGVLGLRGAKGSCTNTKFPNPMSSACAVPCLRGLKLYAAGRLLRSSPPC